MNVFDKALAEMRTRGRTSGDLIDENGHVCALGAIGLAKGLDIQAIQNDDDHVSDQSTNLMNASKGYPEVVHLGRIIAQNYPDRNFTGWGSVWMFNDETTDDDEVYAMFEKASVEWDAKIEDVTD
jgi:hypothetical protein